MTNTTQPIYATGPSLPAGTSLPMIGRADSSSTPNYAVGVEQWFMNASGIFLPGAAALQPITPKLLATIPYSDFTTASGSIYPYYLSVLTRNARARTFQIYNTMNEPLTSNALAFYDSALGVTGQPGIAQTAVFTAAGSNAISTVTSESASASSQGLVASHVDSFQAVLGIGATLPTSGDVYIYVSELL